MNKILVVVSDLHINSTLGLCLPEVELDDGGSYVSSTAQRWIYQNWLSFWNNVFDLRDKNESKLIVVVNGDAVDLNSHSRYQLISSNRSDVIRHSLGLLQFLQGVDSLYFTRGTSAHVGDSAELEERLAEELGARPTSTGRFSHWQLDLDINGKLFNIEHHGRVGRKPWTVTNPLLSLATEILTERTRENRAIPHYVLRGHCHIYADTGSMHPVRVIQTPAFQLASSYVYRIGATRLADIGGVFFSVGENGECQMYNQVVQLKRGEAFVE